MSLTQDDLQAIQQIVQTTVRPMIDEAVDTLAQSTAAGFSEVHEKFAQVDARFVQIDARFTQVDARFAQIDARFAQVDARFDTIDADLHRIENKLGATIEQVEDQEVRLKALEPKTA